MKISPTLWYHAVAIERECLKQSEPLTRQLLKDGLKIQDNLAREIKFSLDNKDIIQLKQKEIAIDNDRTSLIIADPHCPYHDVLAWEKMLEFAEQQKITDIDIIGDLIDMYEVSCFVKVDRKLKKSVKNEIDTTKKVLADLRLRFPDAKIRYKMGNHESRMERYIMTGAEALADMLEGFLAERLGLSRLDIEYIIEPYKVGKLYFLHGHEFYSGGGVQKVCSKGWGFIHDHFVCGHFHRTDSETKVHIDKDKLFNLNSIGWLGSKDAASYAPLNRYNQGFGIVKFQSNGNFILNNYRMVCGEIF